MPAHYETAFRSNGADIIYFSDDGTNWNVTKTPLPLMDESTVTEVGTDGEIVINMRSTSRLRAVATSKDGGVNFGEIKFDTGLQDPVCEASITTIFNAKNESNNGVVMFSNPNMAKSRSKLTIKFSEDNA